MRFTNALNLFLFIRILVWDFNPDTSKKKKTRNNATANAISFKSHSVTHISTLVTRSERFTKSQYEKRDRCHYAIFNHDKMSYDFNYLEMETFSMKNKLTQFIWISKSFIIINYDYAVVEGKSHIIS